jgi:hypothetical protein
MPGYWAGVKYICRSQVDRQEGPPLQLDRQWIYRRRGRSYRWAGRSKGKKKGRREGGGERKRGIRR